ncbi:DNA polymerase III subunit delta' [Verrucomicrobia bacterium S94]|nr:DNA polymerase III subunit delta' [Verrucomicrobia bacterium S94]
MDVVDLHAEAWAGIKNGYETGRLAHAYVIVGSPRGNALQFAESFLKLLYCERAEKPCNACSGCRQVEAHSHVDTLWIEPMSKSRQILAEDVRGLIQRMTQTSFEGGWKSGVILSADCMNESSENALLKTLEEPPANTLLLLVTDSAEALLPTIISRCQKIVLSEGGFSAMDEVWREPLMTILHAMPPSNGLEAARLASLLKALLDRVKEGISDAVMEELDHDDEALDESKLKVILEARTNARLKEVQADVFRVMLDWQRDVLLLTSGVGTQELINQQDLEILEAQMKMHTQGSALKAVQDVEAMSRRVERNIPDLQIFDEAFRKLARR